MSIWTAGRIPGVINLRDDKTGDRVTNKDVNWNPQIVQSTEQEQTIRICSWIHISWEIGIHTDHFLAVAKLTPLSLIP